MPHAKRCADPLKTVAMHKKQRTETFSILYVCMHMYAYIRCRTVSRIFSNDVLFRDFAVPGKSKDKFLEISGPMEPSKGNSKH